MKKSLSGVRVIELGDQLSQYAGKLLADMGAEVIKLEPKEGVPSRRVGPFHKDKEDINKSVFFWNYNTSKKSVIIDIEKESNTKKMMELLKNSDVLIEDIGQEKLKSLGLNYSMVSTINDNLVYCSVSPFGQDGPWSSFKSCDLVQMALGGVMAVTGYDDISDTAPIAPTGGHSNHLAGYFAVMGIVGALFHREINNGEGRYIDISAHDCVSASTEMSIPFWIYQKKHVKRQTGRHALPRKSSPWNFKCGDGKYVLCLNTYLNEKKWRRLVSWLSSHGMEQDLCDENYVSDQYRALHMDHVCHVLQEFCQAHDSEYIYHRAQKIGLPWAPVRAPVDALYDNHLAEDRGAFVKVDHPELDRKITYPGAPYKFSLTPWGIGNRAPLLGEHNHLVGVDNEIE